MNTIMITIMITKRGAARGGGAADGIGVQPEIGVRSTLPWRHGTHRGGGARSTTSVSPVSTKAGSDLPARILWTGLRVDAGRSDAASLGRASSRDRRVGPEPSDQGRRTRAVGRGPWDVTTQRGSTARAPDTRRREVAAMSH